MLDFVVGERGWYEPTTCNMVNPGASVPLVTWLILVRVNTCNMVNPGTSVLLVTWFILVRVYHL